MFEKNADAIADYLAALRENVDRGDATEATHRPSLKILLEAIGAGIIATNEPRRILCGAPDFNIARKNVPLGHVETKDIDTNLDEIEKGKGPHGEQFKRYLGGLPNWILTDYLEFRWFVGGEKRLIVRLAKTDAKGKLMRIPDGAENVAQLLNAFFNQSALTISTAKDLAERLAGIARIIRDLTQTVFEKEVEKGWLHNWLSAFRDVLIPDLSEQQFADMFAQTLAYGLFAARVHTPPTKEFSREMAAFDLPKTNPFLRKLFSEIAGVDMPETVAWAVDDIVELLKHADMPKILKDFGKGMAKEDPVVHFYETFLAAYDPKMRKIRGVYYTPEPVVSYIVRSIDYVLKTRFERLRGLADENTLILDPATGTATFLYFVISEIYKTFGKQRGAWNDYVDEHLLSRIFGFEILIAPYAVAHLKLGMQLQETGYRFGTVQRLGVYLTNTLEEAAKKSEHLFANWIAEEANDAAAIKKELPIMVVLGNPPYSNFGRMNRNPWILRLLEDYKKGLREKKLNIDDDFIKFIRFAQWRIETAFPKTKGGVIGFITNNTYLDGITHRRMRECLLESFSEIYLLNLHGNLRKKEIAPDGRKDENVFDIQQGVAVAFFVKSPAVSECRVFYADLWGDREGKYSVLRETDISTTDWIPLKPLAPNYFFVPREATSAQEELEGSWSIKDIFTVWGSGFNTDRDSLCVDFNRGTLVERMKELFSGSYDEKFRDVYNVRPSSSYDPEARAKATTFDENHIHQVVYRPFDSRFVYYQQGFTSRPVFEVQSNMLQENLGLVAARQSKEPFGTLTINTICTHKIVTVYDRSSLFPLYVYAAAEDKLKLEDDRRPNFNPAFLKAFAEHLGLRQTGQHDFPEAISPEDIFHYAYAVFHSPTYRTRYAESLKIDFPRLPLTSDLNLFRELAAKGKELVALHLLKPPIVDNFITEFPVEGSNEIEKVQYTDTDERIWINKNQYFGGVPKAVWEFEIGGVPSLRKMAQRSHGPKINLRGHPALSENCRRAK